MALPTGENLMTLDFTYYGSPIVVCPTKASIVTGSLDYTYYGSPIVMNDLASGSAPTSDIKKMGGVAQADIKKAGGVSEADIKKAGGVSN